MTELNCWNAHCAGTLQGTESGEVLLECPNCGDGLNQETVQRMAQWDSPMGQLANVILAKAGKKKVSEMDRRCVYVAQAESGHIKIGKSNNPHQRIQQLEVGNPESIELLASVKVDHATETERRMHKQFQEYRAKGEWFDVPESDVDTVIETLREYQ